MPLGVRRRRVVRGGWREEVRRVVRGLVSSIVSLWGALWVGEEDGEVRWGVSEV